MARPYSLETPHQVRDRESCGLHEAKKKIDVSRLLDKIEVAETVLELRALLAEFVTMQTGIS